MKVIYEGNNFNWDIIDIGVPIRITSTTYKGIDYIRIEYMDNTWKMHSRFSSNTMEYQMIKHLCNEIRHLHNIIGDNVK